jgi:hypothetical protein
MRGRMLQKMFASLFLPLLIAGCAVTPTVVPPAAKIVHEGQPYSDAVCQPPVDNFGMVSAGMLYRGARPDMAAIHRLCTSAYRIKTIVNLEMEDDDLSAIQRENVRYFHFPIIPTPFFWLSGGGAQIQQFLAVVAKAENQPVYVHCRHGADRTGEAVAAYRILVQGWGYEKAAGELTLYHHFEMLYPQVKQYLRTLAAARPVATRVAKL